MIFVPVDDRTNAVLETLRSAPKIGEIDVDFWKFVNDAHDTELRAVVFKIRKWAQYMRNHEDKQIRGDLIRENERKCCAVGAALVVHFRGYKRAATADVANGAWDVMRHHFGLGWARRDDGTIRDGGIEKQIINAYYTQNPKAPNRIGITYSLTGMNDSGAKFVDIAAAVDAVADAIEAAMTTRDTLAEAVTV